MSLVSGEKVFYRTLPEVVRRTATVISADGETVTLGVDGGERIEAGRHVVISSGERQYFGEVAALGNGTLTVRRTWSNSREYFRVDDAFPMTVRKLDRGEPLRASRSFPVSAAGPAATDPPGPDVNPQLWQMLVNLQSMLGMVLERLDLQAEGLLQAEKKQVNLSATGIRFRTAERFLVGDGLEVKLLLPARAPVGLLLYGSVVRAEPAGDGEFEIAVRFADMSDELRDEIIHYALLRQRDIIRQTRE